MPLRSVFAAATAVSLSLAAPAFTQDNDTPDLDMIVATVNGVQITLGHMIAVKESLPEQYQELSSSVLFTGILDQLISQTALVQSFEGETPKRIQLILDNEHRSLVAGEMVAEIMGNAVTPSAVQAAYDARFATESASEEYNASHILVASEEEAAAVKAEIEAGADFAEVAQEKSTGPSGPRGGSLGWFGTGQMVPSFEAAVIALRPGELSDPVQTQFGWHIIQLNETRIKEAPKLEEVRAQLEDEVRNTAVTSRIEELLEASEVDRKAGDALDPEVIKTLRLNP